MERHQAIVENGVITNIILADSWPDAIEVTGLAPRPSIGWTYDGTTFTAPPAPPAPPAIEVTQIERAGLLARMTPVEVHGWIRAAQRAQATNTPVVADRNALYAWYRWESMNGVVDMASDDIKRLAQVWMSLGMTQARAAEILTPLAD